MSPLLTRWNSCKIEQSWHRNWANLKSPRKWTKWQYSVDKVSFIKQEAVEKARETKIKADEEFSIEKGKLVRQETIQIEEFFERKLKQQEIQNKIAGSHLVNKNRLKVLQRREELLNQLFSEINVETVSEINRLPRKTMERYFQNYCCSAFIPWWNQL